MCIIPLTQPHEGILPDPGVLGPHFCYSIAAVPMEFDANWAPGPRGGLTTRTSVLAASVEAVRYTSQLVRVCNSNYLATSVCRVDTSRRSHAVGWFHICRRNALSGVLGAPSDSARHEYITLYMCSTYLSHCRGRDQQEDQERCVTLLEHRQTEANEPYSHECDPSCHRHRRRTRAQHSRVFPANVASTTPAVLHALLSGMGLE